MDYFFDAEQGLIAGVVKQFAEEQLEPIEQKMDEDDYWPADLFLELGKLGLLAPTVDENYGGGGTNYTTQTIILEELAKVSPAFALSVGAHSNLTLDNINRHATEAQKAKYLPRLCTGEWVGCLCISEPNAGSNSLGLKTKAKLEGEFYVLNGSKIFITNAPIADLGIIYAKVHSGLGSEELAAFLVELDSSGVRRGKPIEKMGMRGSLTGELFFENVKVPKENVIGKINAGKEIMMSGLSAERVALSGISLGISETVSQRAFQYALKREQFGEKIVKFQLIKEKIAIMYTEVVASRLIVYWAANELEKNSRANKAAAAAIMYAAEKSVKLSLDAIQIMGGYGYMKEYKVEKFMRDAKLLEIGGGTTEIRKLIIANDLIKSGVFKY